MMIHCCFKTKHRGWLPLFAWALIACSNLVSAQKPLLDTGRIINYSNFPSQFIQPRQIDVWLPEGYSTRRKYAVLYMYDGQMLFDSTQTWNKQEWGVDETISSLTAAHKIRDCIVVAIWNNGRLRHTEYFPQKPFESLKPDDKSTVREALVAMGRTTNEEFTPQSDLYLRFIVEELKPFIDRTYSTKKDRKNTCIVGSSMGGLISLYAICEYPNVFGGAGCLSTHWPGIFRTDNNPIPDALVSYLDKKLPEPGSHRIYFDHGTATLDSLYAPTQARVDALLRRKGYSSQNWTTRVFPGEDHSERAWRRRLDQPMLFLLGRRR